MNQVFAALDAAWKVLAVGLLLGAGLPTLFALGVRSLAWGAGRETGPDEEVVGQRNPLGRVIAYVLFAIVLASVALGISYIVAHGFGYSIVFDNGLLPTIKKK